MNREEQLRMLLHPEKYTQEQLDRMLDLTGIDVPDTTKEWARFKQERVLSRKSGATQPEQDAPHPTPRHRSPLRQAAAVLIGVLMLSGLSYAAIYQLRQTREKPVPAAVGSRPGARQATTIHDQKETPTQKSPVIYNNVELEQMMQHIADRYGVQVIFRNEQARTLRFYLQWEHDDTLQDIINKINHFEKVHLTLHEDTLTIE